MRGLILAGGTGTRLRPITHTSAKQLVPVANKPILFYGLEAMADAGITEVGVVVGESAPEIRDAVGDGSEFGVSVTYIAQHEPLGIAHCVLIARDFLGDEPFVVYLGDNMLEAGLVEFVARYRAAEPAPAAQILLSAVEDASLFGVAELGDDGQVLSLVEKPVAPTSNLALVGVYLLDRRVHDAVAAIQPSARGELEITDALQWLIDQRQPVEAALLEGWWIDTGKKDPLLECNRLVLDTIDRRIDGDVDAGSEILGAVRVDTGAKVERSTLHGPTVIGAGARIVDSTIGPYTSIAADCEIVDARIEDSVVLDRTRIVGVGPLVGSLLGRDVEVTRSPARGTQLLVGDDSHVELTAPPSSDQSGSASGDV